MMAMATLQTKPAGLKVIFSFQKTTSWADIYEALGLKPSSSDAKVNENRHGRRGSGIN